MTELELKMEKYLEENYIRVPDITFQKYVITRVQELIKSGKYRKESQIYQQGNIDRRVYSRLKQGVEEYRPSKGIALAYCLALELTAEEAERLLYLAGYHFEHSRLADQIVKFCLKNEIYSADVVNSAICCFSDKYYLEKMELIGSFARE